MTASRTPAESIDLGALFGLAQREQQAGRLAEAAQVYRQILAQRPDLAEAHNNLGVILGSQGKLHEAEAHLKQAVALRPQDADAHNNLGIALWKQDKTGEAAAQLLQALALRPDYAEAQSNLGAVLTREKRYDEARQWLEKALALRPDYAEAYNNLGSIFLIQGELDEAADRFGRALTLGPDYIDARYNLGNALMWQWELDRAVAQFERVLALDPRHADAEFSLATCYLLQEDYDRGWPRYESRLRLPGVRPAPNLPRWQGEPLDGRRLLLLGEQGLGDTIQFLRYARAFKHLGAYVSLAAQPQLGRLLQSHPDVDELFLLDSGREFPAADFYLPLASSGGALATTTATIPHDIPYLWADPELTSRWRQELDQLDGVKIGIFWQGSRFYGVDRWRSIPLAAFQPLAELDGVRLVSLQKGFGTEQLASVDFPVLDLSDRLDEAAGPFMDTAALISNLDLVVSADTAIAHLAAALGAPVFLALQFAPDWRWLRGREDSPWYPTVRLFRQTKFGQWSDVLLRVAASVADSVLRDNR